MHLPKRSNLETKKVPISAERAEKELELAKGKLESDKWRLAETYAHALVKKGGEMFELACAREVFYKIFGIGLKEDWKQSWIQDSKEQVSRNRQLVREAKSILRRAKNNNAPSLIELATKKAFILKDLIGSTLYELRSVLGMRDLQVGIANATTSLVYNNINDTRSGMTTPSTNRPYLNFQEKRQLNHRFG